MRLNERQRKMLLSDLAAGRSKMRDGFHYLEQWDVRRHLIRIFGPTGFDVQILNSDLVSHVENDGRHTVVWKVTVRLTVKPSDESGHILDVAIYEAVATGAAQNMPNLAKAHDQAIKSAESDALKRAAVNLGTQFGLSLYNNGSNADVVKWTLDREEEAPEPSQTPQDEPVVPEPTEEPESAAEPQESTPRATTEERPNVGADLEPVLADLRAVYDLPTAAQKVQRVAEIKMGLSDEVLNATTTVKGETWTIARLIDKIVSDAMRTPVDLPKEEPA